MEFALDSPKISAKLSSKRSSNDTHVPFLGHSQDGTCDADTGSESSGDTERQILEHVVILEVVTRERALAEDEVLLDQDRRVDRQPVREEDEERVEPGLERVVTRQRENNVFAQKKNISRNQFRHRGENEERRHGQETHRRRCRRCRGRSEG